MKLLAIALLLILASSLAAQTPVRAPQGWSLGLAAGGAAYTDFQRSQMVVTRQDASGAPEQQEFPRRIGAQTTGTLAGTLSYWPNGSWGLRLYGSYSPSRFQTILTRSAAEFAGSPRISSDSVRFASLHITAYQLQAVFRFPTIHDHIMPYGIVGGGQAQYTVAGGTDPVPSEIQSQMGPGTSHQFAATVGAGAMLMTRRPGWGLHFELMDRFSRTPVRQGPVHMLNALSFTIGLNWKLSAR